MPLRLERKRISDAEEYNRRGGFLGSLVDSPFGKFAAKMGQRSINDAPGSSAGRKYGKIIDKQLMEVIEPRLLAAARSRGLPREAPVRHIGSPMLPRPLSLEDLMAGTPGTMDMPQRPLNPIDARLSDLLSGRHQLQIR